MGASDASAKSHEVSTATASEWNRPAPRTPGLAQEGTWPTSQLKPRPPSRASQHCCPCRNSPGRGTGVASRPHRNAEAGRRGSSARSQRHLTLSPMGTLWGRCCRQRHSFHRQDALVPQGGLYIFQMCCFIILISKIHPGHP